MASRGLCSALGTARVRARLHPVAADRHGAPLCGARAAVIDEKLGAFVIRACAEATGELCDDARPGQHSPRRKAIVFGNVKLPDHTAWGYARRPHGIVEDARELANGCSIIFADDGLQRPSHSYQARYLVRGPCPAPAARELSPGCSLETSVRSAMPPVGTPPEPSRCHDTNLEPGRYQCVFGKLAYLAIGHEYPVDRHAHPRT